MSDSNTLYCHLYLKEETLREHLIFAKSIFYCSASVLARERGRSHYKCKTEMLPTLIFSWSLLVWQFNYNPVCGSIACGLGFDILSLSRYKGRVSPTICTSYPQYLSTRPHQATKFYNRQFNGHSIGFLLTPTITPVFSLSVCYLWFVTAKIHYGDHKNSK